MPRSLLEVNPTNPINRQHPLNRGTLFWMMGLPHSGHWGSNLFRNLYGGRHGVLTGGPLWSATPTGQAVSLDATNDYIDCGAAWPNLSGAFSLAMSVRFKSLSGFNMLLTKTNSNQQSPWDWYTVAGNGLSRFFAGGAVLDGTTQVTVGPVYRLHCVYDGTNLYQYLNGQSNGSVAKGTPPSDAGLAIKIGTRDDLFAYASIVVYDARVWNRGISASEAAAEYTESLQGWPNLLNWRPRATMVSVPAGGGGGNRRRRLICAGAM